MASIFQIGISGNTKINVPLRTVLATHIYIYIYIYIYIKYSLTLYIQFAKVPIFNFISNVLYAPLGTRRLCWHNFEHNRYLKALSIMPA